MAHPQNIQDTENYIVFGAINRFVYTNWNNTTSTRHVIPHCLRFGISEYHKEPQWLLEGFDVDKQALRTFALSNIHPR